MTVHSTKCVPKGFVDFFAVRHPAQNLHLDGASQLIVILKNPNRNTFVATLGAMKVQVAQPSVHPLRIMRRLAACLATAAIRAEHRARYYKLSDFLYELSLAHDDGTYIRERTKLVRYKLLILDDFGKVTMNDREKNILFDILDDRVGTLSTIVVGQRPYNDWHGFIDDPIIADAILDRLSRERYHIKLRGESMRRKEASFDRIR